MCLPSHILILIDDSTSLRYFHPVIARLLREGRHTLTIVARREELAGEVRRHFPALPVLTGYSQESFHYSPFDLIICNQIWWWDIIPFLDAAIMRNIPILHYDHGSLIFLSEYLVQGEEMGSAYRNDVYRCSHIACWGARGKECWVSYGVPEEKLHLTGAVHLDELHTAPRSKRHICSLLGVPENKKIIFAFTSLAGQLPHFDNAQVPFIEQLEQHVAANPEYLLVVKSHPSEMLWFERPRFRFSPATKLIANPIEDCRWQDVVRVSADEVVAVSEVVFSPFSSALLTPMSLNVPIILLQYDSPLTENFVSYCCDAIIAVSSADQLSGALESAAMGNPDCSTVASSFNHENDGHACSRFLSLIENILEDRRKGIPFYRSEGEELLLSVRRYPFLPYPYYHLIKYYLRNGDGNMVDYWLEQYLHRFSNPVPILRELAQHFFTVGDWSRVQRYLGLHAKYKSLDFETLHMLKLSYTSSMASDNTRLH